MTPMGLVPTPPEKRRVDIHCVGASREAEEIHLKSLLSTWADKSPADAAAVLSKDDIIVTNQRDKIGQLEVLRKLAETACLFLHPAQSRSASDFDEVEMHVL